jgi:hypothetical protein
MSLESPDKFQHTPRFHGVILLLILGSIWLFIGFIGLRAQWFVILPACGLMTLLLLALSRRWFRRASQPQPQILIHGKLSFAQINIIQTFAIFIAIFWLIKLGVPQFIPGMLCAIVALHFLALAPIFQQPEFTKAGVALLAISGLGFFVTILGSDKSISLTAIPAGLTLWITALAISYQG